MENKTETDIMATWFGTIKDDKLCLMKKARESNKRRLETLMAEDTIRVERKEKALLIASLMLGVVIVSFIIYSLV